MRAKSMDKIIDTQEVERITCTALGNEGQGIARLDSGKVVLVHGLLPGEIGTVRITSSRSKIATAELIHRENSAPNRVVPECELSGNCGCDLMHMTYEAALEYKQNKVRDALIRIGRFDEDFVNEVMRPIVGADESDRYSYRNHMQYAICEAADGGQTTGQRLRGTNSFVRTFSCKLENSVIRCARRVIDEVLSRYPSRLFSGVILRGSDRTRELLVELVTESDSAHEIIIRDAKAYIEVSGLVKELSSLKMDLSIDGEDEASICLRGIVLQMCHSKADKRTRRGTRHILFGEDSYHESMMGKMFKIKAGAFFQVNTTQAEKLFGVVKEAISDADVVYDLYCGTGTIGICTTQEKATLVGVEVSPEAVASAKENARINGMTNARFVCKMAEKYDYSDKALPKPTTVIVDPPRKGLDVSIIRKLVDLDAPAIVYVSCDPATLARDLKNLASDYRICSATPVDLFPWSSHVEVVSLLQRVSNTRERTITLDVEMEDYHRIVNGDDHNK